MSAMDDLVAAVEASSKMDAGTKQITTAFLRQAGPALGALLPEALHGVMEQLAGGNRAAAIETVASTLSQADMVAMLDETQRSMDGLVAAQDARRAAGAALVGALERAALSVVIKALISAL